MIRLTPKLEPVGGLSSGLHLHLNFCLTPTSHVSPLTHREQQAPEGPVHFGYLDFTISDAGELGSWGVMLGPTSQ